MTINFETENQADQLSREKRAVSYDSYDISVRQIIDMVESGEINIAPEYQRHFVWDEARESELIESIFLGIPVPSLFMATNNDSSWEVVDGVQRISTILHFCGSDKALDFIKRQTPLKLEELIKLSTFNGSSFSNLPKAAQFQFLTRPLRVTTLNDKSDSAVRYDLFERLNTGAVELHPQEIRNCVYRGLFTDFIKHQSQNKLFRKIVKLPKTESQSAGYEECVLRFFAFRDRYMDFTRNVTEFLNEYAMDMNKRGGKVPKPDSFEATIDFLAHHLPHGITRRVRNNITPINFYEAVAVGSALALESGRPLQENNLQSIIESDELKKFTTAGTNSKSMVIGRINFVRDRLMS